MANRVYGYQGYKGYQFETSPRKLQPEYEPEQEQKQVKKQPTQNKEKREKVHKNNEKRQKASREEIKRKATFVAYILFGFSILFTISYRNSIINEKFNEKENSKSQLAEIQKINEQLEVSVENELNLTSIEEIAKDKLGMSKLDNNQKVYVDLPKKEYVESKVDGINAQDSKSVYEKVVNFVTNIF